MRARVALCPEFDRRIAFESGKRVGIWIDTCGLDKFGVYKLANGAIYLESEVGFGNSYIIDSKNEKVYEALYTYAEPDAWRKLQWNGMTTDNSWENAARNYVQLYLMTKN